MVEPDEKTLINVKNSILDKGFENSAILLSEVNYFFERWRQSDGYHHLQYRLII